MHRTTEQDSNHHNLEQMNVLDILNNINKEDKTVAFSVEKAIPQIEALCNVAAEKIGRAHV